jgi:hypothetical protein
VRSIDVSCAARGATTVGNLTSITRKDSIDVRANGVIVRLRADRMTGPRIFFVAWYEIYCTEGWALGMMFAVEDPAARSGA